MDRVLWDDEPGGNVDHVAEHGLTPEEVDEVLLDDSIPVFYSKSSRKPCKFGYTSSGKHIIVIWVEEDDFIYPVTAYEVAEPS
jgi:hypothetical protein